MQSIPLLSMDLETARRFLLGKQAIAGCSIIHPARGRLESSALRACKRRQRAAQFERGMRAKGVDTLGDDYNGGAGLSRVT